MTDERITAYLLEELTEQESEQFEEQCFAQDEWPEQIDAAEQELIDAYLRNELTSDRKRRFQERYLTTDARKARVLAARTMQEVLCPQSPEKVTFSEKLKAFWQRPLVPQAAVAVLVLAIGIGIFLPQLLRSRPPQTVSEPQTFKEIELATSTADRSTSGQSTLVSLPLSTDALRIHLKLPKPATDATGYSVQLENVNSQSHELKIVSQDFQSIAVIIPATELKPGRYLLRLFRNNENIGNYFFTAR